MSNNFGGGGWPKANNWNSMKFILNTKKSIKYNNSI